MRCGPFAVALVSLFQCRIIGTTAGDPPVDYTQVALKKAVEESVAAPLSEFWKDIYDFLVRKKGAQALRRLRYSAAGLRKNDALELSRFLMNKLKEEVFKGYVGDEMWDGLTMELYYLLKDWWSSTPENPKDAADLGAWHSLVKLYKEMMAPALRGSPRVEDINKLLLDPELETLRSWIEEWKGVPSPSKDPEKEKSDKENSEKEKSN